MRDERLSPVFSGERHKHLLIVCAVAVLCFSQAALAQSGRRRDKSVSPPPPASTAATAAESATDPSSVKPPVPISSVIVVGDLVQSGKSRSNYVDKAVDACVERLKERQVIEAKGSGSRKREAVMELAKNETEAYVLWLEIKLVDRVVTDRGAPFVEQYVSCVDYYVFMPQTAKILTEGRVYPGQQEIKRSGTVMRLPTRNKSLSMSYELREIGQQVADRVRNSFIEHRTAEVRQ
jgi:hypothetical protein